MYSILKKKNKIFFNFKIFVEIHMIYSKMVDIWYIKILMMVVQT